MVEFEVKGHEHSLLPEGKKWKLVFSDEFDGEKLDESKWSYRLDYWGERFAAYTDKGVYLDGKSNAVFKPVFEDGCLRSSQLQTGGNSFDQLNFEAIQNRINKKHGDNPWKDEIEMWPLKPLSKPKFMHRFGYYEARVKFQKLNFWWSAFWLQSPSIGAAYNPALCGVENDVIENFGNGELTSGNIYGGYGKQFQEAARVRYPFVNDGEYHRVGMEWSKDGYVFYLDGKETARTSSPVSEVEQFILISTEVQEYRRNAPTAECTEEVMADRFYVDYVRVFDNED